MKKTEITYTCDICEIEILEVGVFPDEWKEIERNHKGDKPIQWVVGIERYGDLIQIENIEPNGKYNVDISLSHYHRKCFAPIKELLDKLHGKK